jgi:hypothetical protein
MEGLEIAASLAHEVRNYGIKICLDVGLATHQIRTWPPRSSDVTPCDYFLWGYIKNRV